ncbi:hypothetical protein PBRA_004378 [Plasmodiophora brassicae]|uniref:DYW domain-containing protein n=1 Tax=Plasmodiophora brassicae TaxID=37360 RepID=A0A0G4IKN9_PLABS|nr:hypothetical protein PBRA_004378 [Plasmodiophora brassicae]
MPVRAGALARVGLRRLSEAPPGARRSLPSSAYDAFVRAPSVPGAVRVLKADPDPHRGWSAFQHVLHAYGLKPRIPFYQAMMMFCRDHMPGKAPDVLRAAVDRGIAVNDTLFCTFGSACRLVDPPLCRDVVDLYARCGPRSHNVIACVATICRIAKQPALALPLVDDAIGNNVGFSEMLTSTFAVCCAEAQTSTGANVAQTLLGLMRSGRVPAFPDNQAIYGNLIKALLSQGRPGAAVDVLSLMDDLGLPPSFITCTNLLSSLVASGRLSHAMVVFDRMLGFSVPVDGRTFVTLIGACKRALDATSLRRLYDHARRGDPALWRDDFVVCSFVSAFDACDDVGTAESIFQTRSNVSVPTAPIFNAMMTAYIRERDGDPRDYLSKGMSLFEAMVAGNVPVDKRALSALVSACRRGSDIAPVKRLHEYARATASLLDDEFVLSAFISAYADCNDVNAAEDVFKTVSATSERICNAMMAAYTRHSRYDAALHVLKTLREPLSMETLTTALSLYCKAGHLSEAIDLFDTMMVNGIPVAKHVFTELVGAGADIATLKRLEAYSSAAGLLQDDRVRSATISAYSRCDSLTDAVRVFACAPGAGVAAFNAMIAAYARHGSPDRAAHCFDDMQAGGVRPNDVTLGALLTSCSRSGNVAQASALIADFENTWQISPSSVETCTTAVSLLSKAGCVRDAMSIFDRMMQRGYRVDVALFRGLVAACKRSADVPAIRRLHVCAKARDLIQDDGVAGSLISAYGHCGHLEDAESVFQTQSAAGVVVFTAMIAVYAHHGLMDRASSCFAAMKSGGVLPSVVTLGALLTGCNHVGDVDLAHAFLSEFETAWNIRPGPITTTCLIDLYGRAGDLDRAEQLAEAGTRNGMALMPLLSACRKHGDLERAERVFAALRRLPVDEAEPHLAAAHVQMANMYTAAGRSGDADRVRQQMVAAGFKKIQGRTTLHLQDRSVNFVAGDPTFMSDPLFKSQHDKVLKRLFRHGYSPDTAVVTSKATASARQAVCEHSEKIAIVYALHALPAREPIRLTKNLRVCADCHAATKMLSALYDREIYMRDANRYHRFSKGKCSCADYW